jgi:hypothetical protein
LNHLGLSDTWHAHFDCTVRSRYGQVRSNGQWVWAGNTAGSGSADEPVICGPLTALTTAASANKTNDAPLDASAVSRFILYLPLWRACSDDLVR